MTYYNLCDRSNSSVELTFMQQFMYQVLASRPAKQICCRALSGIHQLTSPPARASIRAVRPSSSLASISTNWARRNSTASGKEEAYFIKIVWGERMTTHFFPQLAAPKIIDKPRSPFSAAKWRGVKARSTSPTSSPVLHSRRRTSKASAAPASMAIPSGVRPTSSSSSLSAPL